MTDPSATPMGKDEVLGEIQEAYRATEAETLAVLHDTVAALYAERDALRDVREVLKRECEALKAERSELVDDVEAMQQTNNDLAAENERLRDALQSLLNAVDCDLVTSDELNGARAALNGEDHE